MKKYQNLILGGGIAGLLKAFYEKDAVIVTDKVGGQFSAPFQLGPKYLHCTPSTIKLMDDLRVLEKYPTRKIKVGFYYDGKINSENTEENRHLYFQKTRGSSSEPYRSSMSGGAEEFFAFSIGVEELVRLLEEKVKNRIIVDKIEKIEVYNKELIGSKTYNFEKLTATIPKPFFCKMAGYEAEAARFKYHPTFFTLVERAEDFEEFKPYDYVYFSGPQPWHRMTKLNDRLFVYESKEKFSPYPPPPDYWLLRELNSFEMKVGQLIQRKDEVEYPKCIEFLGRYANWNHSLKTQEVLDMILTKLVR